MSSPAPEPLVGELSRLLHEAQAQDRVPSISAAAIGNGEVVWEEAFGLAHVVGELEATTDTQYRVGSITKTITATKIEESKKKSS